MKRSALLALGALAISLESGCAAPIANTLSTLPANSGVIATWNFDDSAAPQTQNGWSSELISGKPHFVPGLHGQGVIVEESSQNFLAPSAANCTETKPFAALRGAKLSVGKDGENSALHIVADGSQERQGAQVFADSPADMPTGWAVASLEIGGKGRVAVQLMDETNYVVGAPLYLDLKGETQRVSPSPIELFSPPARLRLSIVNVDKTPADFRISQLQIEPLPSATSWLPGGTQREDEALEYSLSKPTGNLKQGTILLWAKPEWNNRTEPVLGSARDRKNRTFFSFSKGRSGPALTWSGYWRISSGSGLLGGVDMLNGGWHLIALTWNGKDAMMYFDGKSTTTRNVPIPGGATLTFGSILNATIDDAALLSTPLSKAALDKIFAAGKEGATEN